LPHFDAPDGTQFITFQLHDSFPVTKRTEFEAILKEPDDSAKRRKLEAWLDRGYGECRLRRRSVAELAPRNSGLDDAIPSGLARGTFRVLNRLLLFLLLVAAGCACGATDWLAPLADQTDPAKLATLGKRGANPRVNRIAFCLHRAQQTGTAPGDALDHAFRQNGTTGLVAALSKETQLLNYQHAQEWGLLTPENLADLKTGEAPRITRGPHAGQDTDVTTLFPSVSRPRRATHWPISNCCLLR
jgi:hypothetical protein